MTPPEKERVRLTIQTQDDPRPYSLGWVAPGELSELVRAWAGDKETARCRAARCSALMPSAVPSNPDK